MRITPFRVLEEHARAEYQKRLASAPEPKVINARALATLDAPRSFVWGGIGYWAPPLSYDGGIKLLVVAGMLRDLRNAGDVLRTEPARIRAASLIRQNVRSRRPLWRLTRAFYRDAAADLEAVIRWLLHVEDESLVVPSEKPVTVDLIHLRYAFEDVFNRAPRSWSDYVHGIRYIGQKYSQQDLRYAAATRTGRFADKHGWSEYERAMREHGGLN